MNKKAQGLSVNTIILITIGILVLAVLIVILSGRVKLFAKGADSCGDKGGECVSNFAACANQNGATVTAKECADKGQVCCIVYKEGEET